MGSTPLHYNFVQSNPYYFNLVISNTAVPVEAVSAVIAGSSVALTRTSNNFWAYHNSDGAFTFPMSITVTPVCGSPVRFPNTSTLREVPALLCCAFLKVLLLEPQPPSAASLDLV